MLIITDAETENNIKPLSYSCGINNSRLKTSRGNRLGLILVGSKLLINQKYVRGSVTFQ